MSTRKVEEYYCDKCGKSLSSSPNNLDIMTSKKRTHLLVAASRKN